MYTPRGKAEMVLLYASGMSQRAKVDEYHQCYPGQPQPSHHLIGNLLTRFKENENVQEKPRTPGSVTGSANSVAVTAKMTASPQRSTTKVAQESVVGRSSVHRTLQRHKFHPYKTRRVGVTRQ
jgi:hypothetical protein